MISRGYLLIEGIGLYIGLPLLFYFDLIPVPKIAALLAVVLLCVLVLWFDSSLDISRLFRRPEAAGPGLKRLAGRGLAVALAVCLLVLWLQPAELFSFPRERPVVWMVVMLLYPLLSALPQELIYREYFFQRYGPLFSSDRARVVASAAAFSFLHIIYDNGWAPALTLAGGLLFADTYLRTRSLYTVSVEHALYGCLVFTIGMGNYFYEPF